MSASMATETAVVNMTMRSHESINPARPKGSGHRWRRARRTFDSINRPSYIRDKKNPIHDTCPTDVRPRYICSVQCDNHICSRPPSSVSRQPSNTGGDGEGEGEERSAVVAEVLMIRSSQGRHGGGSDKVAPCSGPLSGTADPMGYERKAGSAQHNRRKRQGIAETE